MPKRRRAGLQKVDADLINLQQKIRRDPDSYRDDFNGRYQEDKQRLEMLLGYLDFITNLADLYPNETAEFPVGLINLLSTNHADLDEGLREKIVTNLLSLRAKNIIDSSKLITSLFPVLISTTSKALRAQLFQKILKDIRASNSKATNHVLNRTVLSILFDLIVSDRASPKGIWAVKLVRELWKRQVWNDARTVDLMKEAALSDNEKVAVAGMAFFLGEEKDDSEDVSDDDGDGEVDLARLKLRKGVNKPSKKNDRLLKKAADSVKKKRKTQPQLLNFSALHLLHNPQGLAEQLFTRHLQSPKSKLNLEHKVLALQLVSRLVGLHKLTLESLYSYFIKYLTPRQPLVTSFLASLAQASHDQVSPDMLEPLVLKISNEFVSEAAAAEVAAAGLTAIREICARQPLAMNEPLLQDLITYRKSKDKGVMMAARSLLGLYREMAPDMLRARDRGKDAALGLRNGSRQQKRFGEVEAGVIEGIELLEQWKLGQGDTEISENEEDWRAWEEMEDSDADSGGWIDVSGDEGDIEMSSDSGDDVDDDKVVKKRRISEFQTLPPLAQSKLATSHILSPADLAKLRELQAEANINGALAQGQARHRNRTENAVTVEDINAAAASVAKKSKEEKIAMAKGDDENRNRSKASKKSDRKREQGKSTTNQEKARQKNFLMTMGKARAKNKRSLSEARRALRGTKSRQKGRR